MFKSLMFLTALCTGVGMPVAFETANNQEVINFEYQNKKMVSYDDENYTITLTADELNNYSWVNLVDSLDVSFSSLNIVYDTHTFEYDDGSLNHFWQWGDYSIYLVLDIQDLNEWIPYDYELNHFYYINADTENVLLFTNQATFEYSSSDYYSEYPFLRQAIELDIQANSGNPMGNVLTEVVSLLVGGIVPFATGIGQGVSDLVSYTFIDNGALSVFGAMIAVFAGIALAVGLSRWVMNFLTSLGAKK